MPTETLEIPALQLQQNGSTLLLAKVRTADLPKFTVLEHYDPDLSFDDPNQGYQRRPEWPRIKKFAGWLRKELAEGRQIRMPTAILLSGRGTDLRVTERGTVVLRSDTRLPIVDGQHRSEGFRYAIEQKGVEELSDYEIPIIIMVDIDKLTEMHQFRLVNGEQKSVRTDLVNMIITQAATVQGDDSVAVGDAWKVIAAHVAKTLNDTKGGPWEDKIVLPGKRAYSRAEISAKPGLRDKRTARAASFMKSIRPIIEFHDVAGLTDAYSPLEVRAEVVANSLDAYWSALRQLMPGCFLNANDYVLQKTPGLFALHQFGVSLMREMFQEGAAMTHEEFVERINTCACLSTEDFWATGRGAGTGGDASKYGSMKGFKELSALLWADYQETKSGV